MTTTEDMRHTPREASPGRNEAAAHLRLHRLRKAHGDAVRVGVAGLARSASALHRCERQQQPPLAHVHLERQQVRLYPAAQQNGGLSSLRGVLGQMGNTPCRGLAHLIS